MSNKNESVIPDEEKLPVVVTGFYNGLSENKCLMDCYATVKVVSGKFKGREFERIFRIYDCDQQKCEAAINEIESVFGVSIGDIDGKLTSSFVGTKCTAEFGILIPNARFPDGEPIDSNKEQVKINFISRLMA